MRLNNWIIAILLLLVCSGCIEPFEPEIDQTRDVMVIDGKITDAQEIQTVTISRSSSYNDPQFRPVSGCVVRVEDDSGNGITFTENGDGLYQTHPEPGFMAVGKAYKLLVFTPEGQAYESDYDSLLASAPIESLSYKVEEQPTSHPRISYYGIRFYANMKGSLEDSRNYLWTYEETWEYLSPLPIQYIWDGKEFQDYSPQLHEFIHCYMTSRLNDFQAGSSALLAKNEIHQQPLNFVSNQTPRLDEKYSLLVSQHSLSYDAFLYKDQIKAQTGDTGGLFETQPSAARGNIYNINDPEEKVLGYFFASQVKQKRITVSDNFDFFMARFDCPVDTAYNLDDFGIDYPYYMYSLSLMGKGPPFGYSDRECHDCRYRGGVITKPDYWDD